MRTLITNGTIVTADGSSAADLLIDGETIAQIGAGLAGAGVTADETIDASGRYVILRDPRGVFGTQHVAPIISRTALNRYGPRLRAVIDTISRHLTAAAMQRMNAQVQIDRRATADVAGDFLRGQGLK